MGSFFNPIRRRTHLGAPITTRDCSICCKSLPSADFASTPTGTCTHPPSVCVSCIFCHVEEEVSGKGRAGAMVVCPTGGCQEQFQLADVERAIRDRATGAALFEQYDRLLLHALLRSSPDFKWCPTPGCGSGQEVEAIQECTFWTCQACKCPACVRHHVTFHTGVTCDEFDEQNAASAASADQVWIKRNAKACPKCGTAIEKSGGCDHMTCQLKSGGCGAEFCWRCLVDYESIRRDGNHRHNESCVHYRAMGGPSEARARKERLAKMRSLLFHHEVKAKRAKKIKSRAYHKVQAKQRAKAQEALGEVDKEAAKEAELKAEIYKTPTC